MSSTLGEFFDQIWGSTEGLVYLPTDKEDDWKKIFFKWPVDRSGILAYVDQQTAMGREVYFSPAIYGPGVLVPHSQVTNEQIISVKCLWADFDGTKGSPAPINWTDPGIPTPSIQVQTSEDRNRHVYWILDQPTGDISFIESSNRSIAYSVNGDTSCWNAVRLLRPPGSVNFGYSKPERGGKTYDVNVLDLDIQPKEPYSRDSFAKLKPVRLQVNQKILLSSDIPDLEHLKMSKSWDPEMIELFRANPDDIDDRSGALLRMAYFGAEQEWSDTEIYGLIESIDRLMWKKYVTRKDRIEILTDMVERSRRKYPAGADNIMFRGLRKSKSSALAPKPFYSIRDFQQQEFKVDWRFKSLLSRQGYLMVFGPSGVGKTQLVLQMSADAAGGRGFMDWDNVLGPCRVLFLSLEMNPDHLKHFTDAQASLHDTDAVLDNFIVAPWGEGILLDRPEGKRGFENLIETVQPQILVIDSYSKIISKSLSEDVPNREMSDYLQAIRERFDTAMIIIHHTNKMNAGPELELSDFFGSTYIFANTDSVLGLGYYNKKDSDTLCLSMPKSRLAKRTPAQMLNRGVGLSFKRTLKDLEPQVSFNKEEHNNRAIKDILGGL